MRPTEFDTGVSVQNYPWGGMLVLTKRGYVTAKNGLNQRIGRGARVLYGRKGSDTIVIGRSYYQGRI